MSEIEALLERLGLDSGTWNTAEGGPTHLPFVKSQLDSLVKLRDHLSGIAETDIQTIARLREQLARLQRGGGS